ncbi:hypothetical protein [Legionella sainthelensi]|uniref:hypothetical protein n=1 Tax=Legionella sainthelensi TaxID=28087 RepID=UPI00216678B2|nr:hypothetical protein [Legionella sainthelensi]
MPNRAAIRWCPKGSENPAVIQYMLLDNHLNYLIYPKECSVNNLKENIFQVMEDIESHSINTPLEVYYKSIHESYVGIEEIQGNFIGF